MFRTSANKFAIAASALLLCAGFVQAQNPPASPLTATWTGSPAPVAVAYDLSTSTAAAAVTINVNAAAATIYDVDPATVPFWLTVSAMNGTTNTTFTLQANAAAASLGVGTYPATVHLKVSAFADQTVPVMLSVTNGASTLSVTEAPSNTVAINWVYGSGPLTQTLTVVSSGQPVAFTAVAANTTNGATVHENIPANWITLSAPSGIASNFGTPIVVSFLNDVLNNAAVGASLTGTVTINYAGGAPIVVAITITVTKPFAKVTSIFPTQVPPSATNPVSIVMTGSGFGATTVVNIGYPGDGGSAVDVTGAQVGGTVTVVNPTTLIVSIPANDTQMPAVNILADAASITLQATNALASEPAGPETATLTVTSAPIIDSITDAAALAEPAQGVSPNVAPYELISIFGSNFNTGAAVSAKPDATFFRYPTSLVVPSGGANSISVKFYSGSVAVANLLGSASLVYVSNTQINALVPSAIIGKTITDLKIVVTYGAKSNAVAFDAKPVAANPGIFTVGSVGQGQGAILLPNFSVNAAGNLAAKGSTVMIYVSGLGTPTSTAADAAGKSAPKAPASCISPASYVAAEALTAPATADGAVILASKIQTNMLPPCFASAPTVTIGGKTATVTYAGWVGDSVAGLYQINATIPATVTSGTAVPVVVSVGTVTSQTGVTMAIQ